MNGWPFGSFRTRTLAVLPIVLAGVCACSTLAVDNIDPDVSEPQVDRSARSSDSSEASVSYEKPSKPTRNPLESTVSPTAAVTSGDSSSESAVGGAVGGGTSVGTVTSMRSSRDERGELARRGLIAFLRRELLDRDELDLEQEIDDSGDRGLAQLAQILTRSRCETEIFVMNADGSSVRQATRNTTRITAPVWSPDGSRFVYVDVGLLLPEEEGCYDDTTTRESQGIFVTDADTLTTRRIGPPDMYVYYILDTDNLVWSPDGSYIGVLGAIDDEGTSRDAGLYIAHADGSGLELVVPILFGADLTEWSWAPDSSAIAFNMIEPDGFDSEIFVVDIDGGIRRLTDNNRSDLDPVWSHDGSQIAYLGQPSDRDEFSFVYDVHVMNSDGTDERRLTDLDTLLYDLRWSPDGFDVYFRYLHELESDTGTLVPADVFAVSVDGSGVRRLTETREMLSDLPEDHPTAAIFSYVVWAPDWSRLALATYSDEAVSSGQVLPDTIRVREIDGLGDREFAIEAGSIFEWTWAPDSLHLLLAVTKSGFDFLGGTVHIYSLDLTKGTVRQLTDEDSIDTQPSWAPTG